MRATKKVVRQKIIAVRDLIKRHLSSDFAISGDLRRDLCYQFFGFMGEVKIAFVIAQKELKYYFCLAL